MKHEISSLSNGTGFVSAPLKERNSVAVGIWVKVGGRDERPQESGISHFLEHLVFKGTKTRSANKIKESVEGVGGSLNAFTSEEYTCFFAKAPKKYFGQVFDVLSDMALNATLKEEDLKKERTVIMEEIKMTQDQPSQLVEEILAEMIWPDHPLGRPLAGTLETVSKMSREHLVGYKEKFYTAPLITIAASGAIDHKALRASVQSRFGRLKSGPSPKKLDLFQRRQAKPRLKIFNKATEQTHLSLGIHSLPKNHPDEYALDILSILLGGNMSSRLFNKVREERGLAYDISSSLRKYHETGAFGVEAGVDNKKAEEALKVILEELDKVAQKPVKDDELRRAKDFYLGQMMLGLENSMNLMLWIGEGLVTLDRCRTPEEVAREVSKVSASDLKRVATNIFRASALNLAIVGPHGESLEKSLSKILSFSRD